MPIRPKAHARGDVKSGQSGQSQREELAGHHLEAPIRRASHACAQRPERPPMTVLRSLLVQPAPVKAQVVVEAIRFEIERVMEERGGGGGQCPHGLRILAQFTEQDGENEGPGVVVGAVAFGKIRNAEDGVLEDSGGVGHPRQMI